MIRPGCGPRVGPAVRLLGCCRGGPDDQPVCRARELVPRPYANPQRPQLRESQAPTGKASSTCCLAGASRPPDQVGRTRHDFQPASSDIDTITILDRGSIKADRRCCHGGARRASPRVSVRPIRHAVRSACLAESRWTGDGSTATPFSQDGLLRLGQRAEVHPSPGWRCPRDPGGGRGVEDLDVHVDLRRPATPCPTCTATGQPSEPS
jgi:hypothetical protein